MRVLVLAQGTGRRWDDSDGRPYLGIPKHLVEVDGETLLARQVRQFTDRGCEVVVVAPDDPRYRVGGRLVTLESTGPSGTNMDKFLATRHLWSTGGRTVITWGDFFYSDELADSIVNLDVDDYHVWRRPGRSKVTGARWDESAAVNIPARMHDEIIAAAERVVRAIRDGVLVHPRNPTADPSHIRTHLAAMCGQHPALWAKHRNQANLPNQTHFDDWSDDFDTPAEWRGWMGRRYAGAHRVGVCIPWCGGDEHRTRSFEWVRSWFNDFDVPVFVGADTSGGRHPNRSAMRNTAARQAFAAGCDVVFFADADTFVPRDQFWAAVHLAVQRDAFVLAFDRYLKLGRGATDRWMRHPFKVSRDFRQSAEQVASNRTDGVVGWFNHASGSHAITRSLWDRIGGYDERFTRWGYEDRAAWCAARALGRLERVHGDAWHWFHPPAADKNREAPDAIAAARLAVRYYQAAGWTPKSGAVLKAIEVGLIEPFTVTGSPDPVSMVALLSEPGGPLDDWLIDA